MFPSDYGEDAKPSVFDEVLRPRGGHSNHHHSDKKKAIQVEIHVFLSPKQIKASILLNRLRLIGIFDVILELKRFVFDQLPEEDGNVNSGHGSRIVREPGDVLKEKGAAKLFIERNLYEDFCRDGVYSVCFVPEFVCAFISCMCW